MIYFLSNAKEKYLQQYRGISFRYGNALYLSVKNIVQLLIIIVKKGIYKKGLCL